jgi:hypothetical protein
LDHRHSIPEMQAGDVLYHWTYVNAADLLEHCANYEAAYEALILGDMTKAHRLLECGRVLRVDSHDPWLLLEQEVERIRKDGGQWVGVIEPQ